MNRVTFAGLGLALALAAAPTVTRAQSSQWDRQVKQQLNEASRRLGDSYEETHDRFTGQLKKGHNESVTITLMGGETYAIIGVCDNDCSDLDFRLIDADGTVVAKDEKTDDVPVVVISPDKKMTYRLRVEMAECKTEPCWYGVGVFRKK